MLLSLGIWTPALVHTEEAGAAAPTEISALQEPVASITQAVTDRKVALDTLWVLVTAFLVFWMNAGFALVKSGFSRAKNAVNILSKNFIVFAISSLGVLRSGLGLDVRRRERLHGPQGPPVLRRRRQQPGAGM